MLKSRIATTALTVLALSASLALPTGAAAGQVGGASAPAPAQPGSAAAVPGSAAELPGSALATWYGPGLYGRKTACGQTLTQIVVGVANRKLPCGTLVKLSLEGHSVVAPVIDRGPYGHLGAKWDLTAGAASALGMTETVRVAAKVVGSAPNTPTLGIPSGAAALTASGGALAS